MPPQPQHPPLPAHAEARRVRFDGAINVRDLGGHRTRDGRIVARGRLYRGDALWTLSDADVERLAALQLRTICDLRAEHERQRWPNRLPATATPRSVGLGFTPQGTPETWAAINRGELSPAQVLDAMQAHYRAFVDAHTDAFAATFDVLCQAEALPALIHCASGKDRTGFGVALVLLALGVDREDILADYVISDRYRRDLGHLFGPQVDPLAYDIVAAADARYLQAALDRIDQVWGSSERYLREGLRLDAARRERLRQLALE